MSKAGNRLLNELDEPTNRYSEETANKICERLMFGGEDGDPMTLVDVCKMKDMPPMSTVVYWFQITFNRYSDWMAKYEFARKMQAELRYDQMDQIRREATNKDNAFAKKVQLEQLRWEVSKLIPTRFGKNSEKLAEEKDYSVRWKGSRKPKKPEGATKEVENGKSRSREDSEAPF